MFLKFFSGIRDPKNVKLLYDVLNFEHREINNVILFVTKNTVVCETSEDAIILTEKMGPINVRMNIILLSLISFNKLTVVNLHICVGLLDCIVHHIVTSVKYLCRCSALH